MSRIDLANHRIQKAKEVIIEAEDNFNQKHYGLSINRSYYAMFTDTKALLALKEMDSKKHSGIIALFNQYIVKEGLFSKDISKYLSKAKDIQEDTDYGDFIEITKEDAEIHIERAKEFVKEIEMTMQKLVNK